MYREVAQTIRAIVRAGHPYVGAALTALLILTTVLTPAVIVALITRRW